MNEIKLNNEDVSFILNIFFKLKISNGLVISNNETIEKLLDLLSDKLMDIGFNDNDEPNEIGIQIEELIDKLSSNF